MKVTRFISVVTALMFLFTGCSASSIDSVKNEAESMKMYSTQYDYTDGAPMEIGTAASAPMSMKSESVKNDLAERKIIKRANLSFETEEYDVFIPAIEKFIVSLGGYIESSEAYGGGIHSSRSRSSYITARIPESTYSKFMSDVTNIGTLTYKQESSEDVTLSYVDTESRLKSLKAEYDALLEILEKADTLDDVIQLQARISEVTYQIESYQSKLRKYDDLISYCTIHIDVSEVSKITVDEEVMTFGERISSGLSETISDIGRDFTDMSVDLIVSLPYIIIWAVIIAAIVVIIRLAFRRIRKKREEKIMNQYLKQINSNNEKENS